MRHLKFEYRISLAYLIIGGLWILFSDQFLNSIVDDADIITEIQTFKGWFYVVVTALMFFFFIKKHLSKMRNTEQELELHKNNLQDLVNKKTIEIEAAMEELRTSNEELNKNHEIINQKNEKLNQTIQHLKEAQSKLIQVEKMASLGVLTKGLAHEINNPLNYILGGVTGLEEYFKKQPDTKEKHVSLFMKSIKTGVERASSIVSGLNQLGKSDDKFNQLCNLHTIIDNCLIIIGNQFENRIKIEKHYSHSEVNFEGNESQIQQVFLNVLLNASQAISDTGVISIKTEKADQFIKVEITDNGCGMDKKMLPKITDPFFTTKEPGEGTGLGLSVTYSFIQAHNGKINFASEPGHGTTVIIELPINIYEKIHE